MLANMLATFPECRSALPLTAATKASPIPLLMVFVRHVMLGTGDAMGLILLTCFRLLAQ